MVDPSPANRVSISVLRRELIDFITEKFSDFEVTEQRSDSVIAVGPEGGEHQIFLANIHTAVNDLEENTLENRNRIYDTFTRAMASTETLIDSPGEQLATQLMPRIIHMDQLRGMMDQIGVAIPHRTLGAMPLVVVYVIDLPESVAFVNDETALKLQMTEAEMYDRGLRNLDPEGVFGKKVEQFESGQIAVVKTGDSYDAARLLLVPQSMDPNMTICAAIPDRDTLVMAVMDTDSVFESVDQMAKIPGSDRLIYDQAIEVTSTGFSIRA